MKTKVSEALFYRRLSYGTKFKAGRKFYTYINKSTDVEHQEFMDKYGNIKVQTWDIDLLIAVDEKGNYKVFSRNELITILDI